MIVDWPRAFKIFAAKKASEREKNVKEKNLVEITMLLKELSGHKASPELSQIIQELREEVQVNGPNGEAILESTLTIKRTSAKLGLGTAKVAPIRRAGHLKTVLVMDKYGKLQPAFDKGEIEFIETGLANEIRACAISWALGISQIGVLNIVEEGLLTAMQHRFFVSRFGCI